MDTLPAGTLVGRDFRILKPLARGGMATIYVAEQLSTRARRAVKVMHPQLNAAAKNRERFEAEARISASIDSDHVVEVLGAGVLERSQMELAKRLQTARVFPIADGHIACREEGFAERLVEAARDVLARSRIVPADVERPSWDTSGLPD